MDKTTLQNLVIVASTITRAILVFQHCLNTFYVIQGSTNTAPQATPGRIWLNRSYKVRKSINQDILEVVSAVTLVKNNSHCTPFDFAIVLSECTDFSCYLTYQLDTNRFFVCFLFAHSERTVSVTVLIP